MANFTLTMPVGNAQPLFPPAGWAAQVEFQTSDAGVVAIANTNIDMNLFQASARVSAVAAGVAIVTFFNTTTNTAIDSWTITVVDNKGTFERLMLAGSTATLTGSLGFPIAEAPSFFSSAPAALAVTSSAIEPLSATAEVSALAAGTATVTFGWLLGGVWNRWTFTVVAASDVKDTGQGIFIPVGTEYEIPVNFADAFGQPTDPGLLQWGSGNAAVASVVTEQGPLGRIRGVAAGVTRIHFLSGTSSASFAVTVYIPATAGPAILAGPARVV